MSPSTPLRSPDGPDPASIAGVSDTERPPQLAEPTPMSPPPASAPVGPASANLRAALPRPGAVPLDRSPSSSRLVAAAPTRLPPVAAPPPPNRQATMIHAGAPPVVEGLGGGSVPLTRRCTACETRYPSDFLVCPRDASPLVDELENSVDDPLLNRLLGETYQIIRVVGEGGMGRVYEARHLRLKERRFAVKVLHGDLAKNNEIVARFMREAESASSLSHPNVVDVFDVHHLPDGTPYLVGEFLDGEELADYVARRGPLEPRLAAAVGRQVCRALAVAHARGIVHRDMKPENVFVLRSSVDALAAGEVHAVTVKVLDFGISKSGDSERSHLTRTGVIMGTPSYMSPEQARGKPVDLRADVYSTGATLYFALTGKRPFDADDPTSTISMVLTQEPPRPRSIDERIPEALELVVQRAMAKEPRDRYQTMGDLEKALAAFENNDKAMVVQSHAERSAPLEIAAPASGASRALELAKGFLLSGGGSASSSGQSATLAKIARPMIVLASAVLGLWLVGGTTAALAGLVRVLHDGEITLTESVLLVVGCLFAAATPIALYVMHVRKVIWPNSVRALQLAGDLKRTATAALIAYGGLSIVARIGHTVLWRSSKGLTSGVWDILLFVVSILAAVTVGGFGPLVRNMRRRRSS
ncbi:MAG TPA: serine/threonine-protein kinase [Labilithrix sp.]|nr:serine/threonine-protein kinase [Labilithrix sp.]